MLSIDVRYPDMCEGAHVHLGVADLDWDTVIAFLGAPRPGRVSVDVADYDGDLTLYVDTDGGRPLLMLPNGESLLVSITLTRPLLRRIAYEFEALSRDAE